MQLKLITICGSVLLTYAATTQAHHSMAMFDQSQVKSLSGTVREFQWTNPHCYIQLMVRNAQGQDEEWSVEMAAPMYLYAKGWRPSSLKAGTRLNIKYYPLRNGGKGGMFSEATTEDGKPVGKRS